MSKLPNFIKKLNFVGASEDDDQRDAMQEQEYEYRGNVTMATLKASFLEFEKKVAIKKFPKYDSPAYELAECVLSSLRSLMDEHVTDCDDNEAKEKQRHLEAWEIQLHTWLALLHAGPGSSHLKLMKDVLDSDVDEYFPTLNKKQIVAILTGMKRDFPDSDLLGDSDHAEAVHDLSLVLEHYTEKQLAEVKAEMVDLYNHYKSRISGVSEDMAVTLTSFCDTIKYLYDEEEAFKPLKSKKSSGGSGSALVNAIKKLKFEQLRAKEKDELQDAISELCNDLEDGIDAETVGACFLEFEKKVAVKNFRVDTRGAELAEAVQGSLISLLGHFVSYGGGDRDSEPKQKKRQKKAWEIELHAWIALLNAGPSKCQLKLMDDVLDRDIDDYFKELTKDQIVALLKLLKRDFVNTEKGDEEVYAQKVKRTVDNLLENYTEGQYAAIRGEMLELYSYYVSRIPQATKEMAELYDSLCYRIRHSYDDSTLFSGITSVETVKKHLESLKQWMVLDAFHEKESLFQKIVAEAFETLLKTISGAESAVKLSDVFDCLMKMFLDLCKHDKCRVSNEVMRPFRYELFGESSQEPTAAIFTCCIVTMTEAMAFKPINKYIENVVTESFDNVLMKYSKIGEQEAKLWIRWFIAALKTGRRDLSYRVRKVFDDNKLKKAFQWKLYTAEAGQILDLVGGMTIADFQDDKDGRLDHTVDSFTRIVGIILKQMRHAKLLPQVTKNLIHCILNCLDVDPPSKADLAEGLSDSDNLNTLDIKDLVPEILTRLLKMLKNKDFPWNGDSYRTLINLLERCLSSYSTGREIPDKCNRLFLEIFLCSMEGEDESYFYEVENPDIPSIHFQVLHKLTTFIDLHEQSDNPDFTVPLVRRVLKWCMMDLQDNVMRVFMGIVRTISSSRAAKEFFADLLELFLQKQDFGLIYNLTNSLYSENPEVFNQRIPDFFEMMTSRCSENDTQTILSSFYLVSQSHAEVFTEIQVRVLLELHRTKGPNVLSLALTIVRQIAEKRPAHVSPCFDLLTDDTVFATESLNLRSGIITSIGHVNQSFCQKAIDYLMKHADDPNPQTSLIVVSSLRTMVLRNIPLFEKHKAKLQLIEKSTGNPHVAESCHNMVLAIEGKDVEGLFEDLKEQQEDIENLDVRVTGAEGTINVIGVKVDDQGREIKDVKKDVVKVEKRVDEVEEDLGDTKIKVEEIDNKTMTNAPKWSRDLTKLMNPVAENDWRLLAKRLGYSNDDIRGWATQHDPCMALLSEWYAVRKTSEASRAVYTALEEMDRMDGLAIVENAMKAAEGVVEDEEFEYASPPPIFLSYQWGMQEEVKLLHKHLNMAGYECWMDIGQMGGGDKLFAKIDNGIRAAKLVICCTTEKYAKSPNCNREVNLSVSLGKPIIPLLMEKMDWPPKGSMGPIFSEYLFIRFFQRGGEETKDQRYWPVPKFQELLMQLNFNKVMPDEGKISKEYRNWWAPPEEVIVIDKNKKKQSTSQASAEKKEGGEESSPDVFLSYQWGKQPQLKELYKRLTGMGYTCWMDIYQMGGGDSLYDKIDRGLRGCKVVVTCVTPKYALSANCRREVSLADALKKPIVPLLLDQMTWPPDGPMSMVFTQLLYINFYRNQDDQMKWNSPQFQEMVDQLKQHLPAIESQGNGEKQQKDKPGATDVKKGNAAPLSGKSEPAGTKTGATDVKKSNAAPLSGKSEPAGAKTGATDVKKGNAAPLSGKSEPAGAKTGATDVKKGNAAPLSGKSEPAGTKTGATARKGSPVKPANDRKRGAPESAASTKPGSVAPGKPAQTKGAENTSNPAAKTAAGKATKAPVKTAPNSKSSSTGKTGPPPTEKDKPETEKKTASSPGSPSKPASVKQAPELSKQNVPAASESKPASKSKSCSIL